MEKTISITLAGLIFHVEESAYDRLRSWLSAVRRHFSDYDDRKEILGDIENRIAEILADRTENQKKAVTSADVDEVIRQIGTVKDFEHFENDVEPEEDKTTSRQKRLYRDRDEAVLGGVAAGVAAYFGIDITLTRVLFIILTLIWGVSLLVYMVMWILMPVADTPAKKLEMKGEPVTLAGLEQRIRAKVPAEEVTSTAGRLMRRFSDFMQEFGEACVTFLRKTGPVLLTVTGVILSVIGAVAMFFVTVVFFVMLTNAPETWYGIPLSQLASSPLIHYILLTCAYLLLMIPSLLIAMAGGSLARSKKKRPSSAPVVLLSIWIVVLLVATILGVREIPVYEKNLQEHKTDLGELERTFELEAFQAISVSGGHEITIVPSDDHFVRALADEQVLERQLSVNVAGNDLEISSRRECIFCGTRPARLEIGVAEPGALTLGGSSRTSLNGFSLERLDLRLSGASRLVSDSEIHDLSTSISGTSRAHFTGPIRRAVARLSGSSRQIIESPLETLNARASGSSRVETGEVTRLIEANLTGGSVLRYAGEPEQSDIRTSSGSRAYSW